MKNDGMFGAISIIVPCRIEFYDGLATLLQTLCFGIEDVWADQIVSAFNESFNNVVQHSQLQQTDLIEIHFNRDSSQMLVKIIDKGISYLENFNKYQQVHISQSANEHDAGALKEHGMGWTIIYSFMSEVTYERNAQNVLTMIRYLNFDNEAT